MIIICFLNNDNWVDGVFGIDWEELPPDIAEKRYVQITPEEFREANMGSEVLWYDGTKLTKIYDKKRIYHRLRNLGLSGRKLMDRVNELETKTGSNSVFPEAPDDVFIGPPKPIQKINPQMEINVEIQPGLFIRPIRFEELDILEDSLFGSGFYPDKDACWRRAWGWYADPNVQLLSVVWENEPLLMEVYYFASQGNFGDPYYGYDTDTAFSRFTVHLDKERPHWFWRVCAGPVFQGLRRCGIKRITTTPIREDRADWKNILKKNYGAKTHKIELDGAKETLEYDVDLAISMTGDFPERKTMGLGWEWRHGNIRLREVLESELPTIIGDLKRKMEEENDPRSQTIERDLKAWWELDHASMILVLKDGEFFELRCFRLKEGDINRVWVLPGSWKTETNLSRVISYGMATWQKGVGYQKSLVVMPLKLYEHPLMQAKNQDFGGRFVRKLKGRKDILECEYDIDFILNKFKNIVR